MATITLTKDTIDDVIENNETVVIDFWASWCAPCLEFAPTFAAASEAHPEVAFAKVDTDQEQELAAAFGVQAIPTLAVFRDQILLFNQPGALTAEMLESLLAQVKALDMDDVRNKVAEAAEAQDAEPGS